jgi:hypothetical protein
MVQWLGVGAVAALLSARIVARLIFSEISAEQQGAESQVIVDAIADAAVDSLMWFTFVLMAVIVIIAAAAAIWERSRSGQRPSEETPMRTLARWAGEHAMVVLGVGLAIIAVMALWNVGGPDIALLIAAALALLAIAVKVMADQGRDDRAAAVPAPLDDAEG